MRISCSEMERAIRLALAKFGPINFNNTRSVASFMSEEIDLGFPQEKTAEPTTDHEERSE